MIMEENKLDKTSTTPRKPEKTLTEEQRQKRKKMLVYPLMFLLFVGSMWLIFAPSAKDKKKEEQGQKFNTDMPLPTDAGIIGDKQKAYEHAKMEDKQKERNSTMQDLASLFGDRKETSEKGVGLTNAETGKQPAYASSGGGSYRPRQTIQSSATAYQTMNRTLGNFYESPKVDSKKEELQQRIDELEKRLASQETPKSTMNDQVALLEKSYELAAKYMPAGQGGQMTQTNSSGDKVHSEKKRNGNASNGKTGITTVTQVTTKLVSGLAQPMSDTAFITAYSQSRNGGFYTAVGNSVSQEKNTIAACIHGDQTLTDGQTVRLRILEPMNVRGIVVPRNSIITGATKLQGERLNISITSLEYGGTITPVELSVFDNDGQEGVFIPNSMESSAIKEVAANMGTSLGSSINISTNAGAQLASDLGKGAIQGTSQYIAKKMRTIKVHLKAGYKVMLYQPEN
ncbi:MAG: conjugative transposon protein TraM [Paludibacter sp.]|nr:conjugative transposon protein TraM [Paludibacter sp.]